MRKIDLRNTSISVALNKDATRTGVPFPHEVLNSSLFKLLTVVDVRHTVIDRVSLADHCNIGSVPYRQVLLEGSRAASTLEWGNLTDTDITAWSR